VKITVHDSRHNLVNGASVRGLWNGSNPEVGMPHGADGNVQRVLSNLPNSTKMVSFGVTALSLSAYCTSQRSIMIRMAAATGSVTVKR